MQKKSNDLGNDSVGRLVVRLAVPAIVAQLVNALYNIVDRIYIGHIADVGDIAMTGLGLCFPIIMFVSALAALAGIGGGSRASILMGDGDLHGANEILGNCNSSATRYSRCFSRSRWRRDKLILLLEAQSKFSVNIALRMLLYLAATYKEYINEQKLDLYGSKPVSIPRPELYMVYTGGPRQLPEVMRLSDMYDGPGSAEVEIKVLRNMGSGNIVDQYIRFCEISDAQWTQYGYTMKAAEETLPDLCGGKHFDAVPGIVSEGGAGHYGDPVRSRARDGDPRVQLGSGCQAGGPRGRHPRHGAHPEEIRGGQSIHCPGADEAV